MSSVNNIKTFSNKRYSTEQFVTELLNLPQNVETLVNPDTNKIQTNLMPVSCFKQNITRNDISGKVHWETVNVGQTPEIVTITHGASTTNIFDLQVRQITNDGIRIYNNFIAFIVDQNSFQINIPVTMDLSEGTWQIFVMLFVD